MYLYYKSLTFWAREKKKTSQQPNFDISTFKLPFLKHISVELNWKTSKTLILKPAAVIVTIMEMEI